MNSVKSDSGVVGSRGMLPVASLANWSVALSPNRRRLQGRSDFVRVACKECSDLCAVDIRCCIGNIRDTNNDDDDDVEDADNANDDDWILVAAVFVVVPAAFVEAKAYLLIQVVLMRLIVLEW